MADLIRLTRPLNLLIIALTMVAMRHGVIAGIMEQGPVRSAEAFGDPSVNEPLAPGPLLPPFLFVLLVLSTVLVAAGGNMINDYFDTRIDRINKPGEVIVGRRVKRRVAMTGHFVLSGLGLLLGVFVAWRSGMPQWALIPAFAIGALWTYSTTFKRRLLVGNGLVAVLAALVPLTVGLYEIPLLERAFADPRTHLFSDGGRIVSVPDLRELWSWILAYSAFAFLSTLVRELQKDMADVKGDEAAGCRTVPIAWGMGWARGLSMGYIGLLLLGTLAFRATLLHDRLSFLYIGVGVMVPLLLSAGLTFNARSREEHVRAGSLMKVAMVMAVVYAMLLRHIG